MKDTESKQIKIIIDWGKIIYIEIHHSTRSILSVPVVPFGACTQLKPPHCGGWQLTVSTILLELWITVSFLCRKKRRKKLSYLKNGRQQQKEICLIDKMKIEIGMEKWGEVDGSEKLTRQTEWRNRTEQGLRIVSLVDNSS
jgi:hypothetical protein